MDIKYISSRKDTFINIVRMCNEQIILDEPGQMLSESVVCAQQGVRVQQQDLAPIGIVLGPISHGLGRVVHVDK
jgi:hypothetical protein